jgi:phosphoribosyl 1,2-cyclic phosphate phosphodiesterase
MQFGIFFGKYVFSMNITLLGTGANECIPAFRCKCPVCEHARKNGGRNIRQNSSLFIKTTEDLQLLIDMPPQIMALLRNSNIDDSSITNILFTHRHEDHILGARYLFQNVQKKGFVQKNRVNLYMPESVYITMSGKFLFNKETSCFKKSKDNYNINIISAYSSFNISDFTITALETNHLNAKKSGYNDNSFGYLIEIAGGPTIVYLLDAAKKLPPKTIQILEFKKIDLLISDCTFNKTSINSGHSDIMGSIELNMILNPVKMIISHIGHRNMNHENLELKMKQYDIEVGFDGMQIDN